MAVKEKKLLFLGIDGMSPVIAEKMMGEGKLPRLAFLAASGGYSRLSTIAPPQSPVVWSTIATGADPGRHGMFDFLHRNPKTYDISLSLLKQGTLGYSNSMHGKPFWQTAAEAGVHSTILRWPVAFPPKKFQGKILAGLGVPDIRGTLGTYTVITADERIKAEGKKGKVIAIKDGAQSFKAALPGPSIKGAGESGVPLELETRDGKVLCSLMGQKAELAVGDWSPHLSVSFGIGFMAKVHGHVRLYLRSLSPFTLYATPVSVSVASPMMPVTAPFEYGKELQGALGFFTTLGMAEDTNGLNDGILDEAAFLKITDQIFDERVRMLRHELKRFERGILACVFDTVDRVQHMFWRHIDSRHPMHDTVLAERFGGVIEDYYARVDAVIGEAVAAAGDARVMVCSDHGFSSLRRMVHVNSFLAQNGYMAFKGGKTSGENLLRDVDWRRTTAYSMGLNSVYLNVAGREGNGIVPEAEAAGLKRRLIADLEGFADVTGEKVVTRAFDSAEIYSGDHRKNGPDIVLGFSGHYRSSWQTGLGGAPGGGLIEDNTNIWAGDHCCHPSYVEGVFFGNEPAPRGIRVSDLAGEILSCFGV